MQAGSRNCQAEMPAALRDHDLEPAVGEHEGGDRAEQGGEGKDVLADARDPVEREQEHLGRVEILGAERSREEFEISDHKYKKEEEKKNRDHQHGELACEVKSKCLSDHRARAMS